MPAAKQQSGGEDSNKTAARFTVALPRETGEQIDKLAKRMADAMRQQFGVGVELSRAQVVQSLVNSALDAFESGDAS
jgi:hypothetical protein